jgi:hypothetical protein
MTPTGLCTGRSGEAVDAGVTDQFGPLVSAIERGSSRIAPSGERATALGLSPLEMAVGVDQKLNHPVLAR